MPTRLGGTVEELDGRAHPLNLTSGGGPTFGPVRVPVGRYLVLGDNRGNSRDQTEQTPDGPHECACEKGDRPGTRYSSG